MNGKSGLWSLKVGVLALALAASIPAQASGLEQTIQSCVTEAGQKHGKYLLKLQSYGDNKYHIKRMRGHCEAWRTVEAKDRAALLKSCQHEAKGMVRGLRAMVYYDDHVDALKGYCQSLHDMAEKNS